MRFVVLLALSSLSLSAAAQTVAMRTGMPTIYSTQIVKLSEMTCAPEKLTTVIDAQANVITTLCHKQYKHCLLEGSCVIVDAQGKRTVISRIRYDENLQRQIFAAVERCPHGLGYGITRRGTHAETCRDPYFSVAADPEVRRLGQVIFVPKLVGVKLPSGETHDGYLVVRDTNEELAGHGVDAFAFFTGHQSDMDPENPLVKLNMYQSDQAFEYQDVPEEKAAQVRKARGYPRLNEAMRKGY